MRNVAVSLIRFYQIIISPIIHQIVGIAPGKGCRFDETCSHYASRMIERYGILRGSLMAVRRILACRR